MTLLAVTLLLGIAPLVCGYPIPTGYGPTIYRNGFGGGGFYGLGNWDVGHNGAYWDHPYAEDNYGFDGPYGIMDRHGISDEIWTDVYNGHGPVGNNYVDVSNDMFRNYGRSGPEF
ncbi:hypothetical protein ACJMK2_009114, partial [Sinanodonta woodiana]